MTYRPKSDFLNILIQRGFLADCTDIEGFDSTLMSKGLSGYIGFDATAQSLHVGSLTQIMMLRWFQKTGHKPITLMGGGTTRIGDPSFRTEMRPILTPSEITANIAGITSVFEKYLHYGEGSTDALMLDNSEWLEQLNYLDFLNQFGRHFSINRMLTFESVKSRLDHERSLSFLEFNYMILQAYDFLELHRRYGCRVQFGGSDQWGNIVNGIDLTRRIQQKSLFGLTSPLLTTSDGKKMGKSAAGAIWLNANMLIPYEFWQYWRNVSDDDVGRFLKLFTELPIDECDRLDALKDSEKNTAKIILANAVTTLCHGEKAAKAAEATAREVFEQGGIGDAMSIIALSAEDLPLSIVQLLVKSGFVTSGKQAKRLIGENGVRINDTPIQDTHLIIHAETLTSPLKLSAGKKRHVRIQLIT